MARQQDLTPKDAEPTAGELMTHLSEQTSRLIHDEMRLAKAEVKSNVKHAAAGAGLFSTAGVLALYGLGAAIVAAVAALALVLPLWASALIVAATQLIAAGVAALVGKAQVRQVSPTPQRTVANVKRDVDEVKEASHHER